jgi:hypothetical protein
MPDKPSTDANIAYISHYKSSVDKISRDISPLPDICSLKLVLKRIFDPAAPPDDQLIANVIRVLAKHLKFIPIQTSDEDLETLLAISIALAQDKR